MGEGKKTRQELEEQKKIAKEVRQAFDKASRELRNSYSEQVRQVLDESDKYRGSVSSTVIGKRLRSFLEKKGARPSEFFRKELKNMPGWLPDALLEDFYVSVDSIIKWQVRVLLQENDADKAVYDIFGQILPHFKGIP